MRKLTIVMSLLLCLALLAGCGGNAAPAATEQPAETEQPAVTAAQEPEEPAETDAPAPTESPRADPAPAYRAYLELLERERESILNYNWQKGYGWDEDFEQSYYQPGTVNVALADIWGDEVPELIYLSAVSEGEYPAYSANLHVMTYADGALKELLTEESYDVQAGGGMIYRLFQIPGERNLWTYLNWRSETDDRSYRQFAAEGETLNVQHEYSRVNAYEWEKDAWTLTCTLDGVEATEADYLAAIPSEIMQGKGLLLRNLDYDEFSEYGSGLAGGFPRDGAGMSVDYAMDYLRELLGEAEGQPVMSEFFTGLPEFWFSSGAGGWGTELVFHDDGSADLSFHDSNMGETGEGYPHGTVYVCNAVYHFTDLKRENAYTWSAQVAEINMDGPEVGEEWIEDEIRYVWSTPYGLEQAGRIYFFAPGAPTTELPRDFMRWLAMPRAWGNDWPLTLPCWGIYSPNDETGFSGG